MVNIVMPAGFRLFKCFSYLNQKTFDCAKSLFKSYGNFSKRYYKSKYVLIDRKPSQANLKTMKLESYHFKSCLTEEVEMLKNLFHTNGFEIRIVGGAVRDLLLGIQPTDLDFATTASPEQMKKMFAENNIRIINLSGEKHGTITARINDKNLEVTTLRVDMATDGRHAIVEFTQDWVLDANRRDLTINAMYLGFDGTLYDYFNGAEDLKNRRIVFVGNAVDRIREDYLRILRYFRFFGRVAENPEKHDEDVINAIRENAEGLGKISGERIWVELNKILTGNLAGEMLHKIVSLNIGPHIGLPAKCETGELKIVYDRLKMKDISVKPVTLLVTLFNNEDELLEFYKRIKPSTVERELGLFILKYRNKLEQLNLLKSYKSLFFLVKWPSQSFRQVFIFELIKYRGDFELLEELQKWTLPVFPVNGHMLKEKKVPDKFIGAARDKLIEIWVEHDFNISAEKLLEQIPEEILKAPFSAKKQRKK